MIITEAGDAGVLVRFGDTIAPATSDAVLAALGAIDAARPRGVIDVMPAYASLLVVLDPTVTTPAMVARAVARLLAAVAARPGATRSARVAARAPQSPARQPRRVEIPVLYDPEVGPDLAALAEAKGLGVAALIERHASPVYRCHMLGFRPGFPFLGGLDPALATPRLPTPRPSVAAGSVAIAGQQTGIYPTAGPGGWRIVGRTPLRLFDPNRADPFLVHAGDEVAFLPVDRARFAALAAEEAP